MARLIMARVTDHCCEQESLLCSFLFNTGRVADKTMNFALMGAGIGSTVGKITRCHVPLQHHIISQTPVAPNKVSRHLVIALVSLLSFCD